MYELINLKEKLKELRIYKGFKNQTKAAAFLGMTRHQYNNYESGNREPGLNTIFKICKILETDIHYFFSNGRPEEFDLRPVGRKIVHNFRFIQTTVSKRVLLICKSVMQNKKRVLVNVLPLSGISTALREFINQNADCSIIDAIENLKKPLKKHVHFIHDMNLADIKKIILDRFAFIDELPDMESETKQILITALISLKFDDLSDFADLEHEIVKNYSLYNLIKTHSIF